MRAGFLAWEDRAGSPAKLDQAIELLERGAALARPGVAALAWLDAAWARRARVLLRRRAADLAAAADDEGDKGRPDAQGCRADVAAARAVPGFDAAARPPARARDAGAEALYLDAVCAADLARLAGFTALGDSAPSLEPALREVAVRAPELDGAGALRELGMLHAAMAGGDLALARSELEAALARAPSDARNRLALARTVAVKAQDRALFEGQLRRVVRDGGADAVEEAQALLDREAELFGPAQAAQPEPGGPQR